MSGFERFNGTGFFTASIGRRCGSLGENTCARRTACWAGVGCQFIVNLFLYLYYCRKCYICRYAANKKRNRNDQRIEIDMRWPLDMQLLPVDTGIFRSRILSAIPHHKVLSDPNKPNGLNCLIDSLPDRRSTFDVRASSSTPGIRRVSWSTLLS